MQSIKSKADSLDLLGSPVDHEDLTDIILEGLDDDYKYVIDYVHSRDTPIYFSELHEKFINRELTLSTPAPPAQTYPITANHVQQQNHSRNWRPSPQYSGQQDFSKLQNQDNRTSRPYLGCCQACGTQGHGVKKCPLFRIVVQQPNVSSSSRQQQWSPQAFTTMTVHEETPSWLLDSGASHHITMDFANMSVHSPYNGGEEVMVADGTGLNISNTGSFHLSSSSRRLVLRNVLHVPRIAKNLISVKRLCTDNVVSVEFFPLPFR